jgi:hypothetical protein
VRPRWTNNRQTGEFSAPRRSPPVAFDRLLETRCTIYHCATRPNRRSWSHNHPERGECRLSKTRLVVCLTLPTTRNSGGAMRNSTQLHCFLGLLALIMSSDVSGFSSTYCLEKTTPNIVISQYNCPPGTCRCPHGGCSYKCSCPKQ